MKKYQIAIDGTSGVGKSTVSKLIAEKLNFFYVNTGAIFRAITYFIVNRNFHDVEEAISNLEEKDLLVYNPNGLFLDTQELNEELKTIEISQMVPEVAKIPLVREYVQRLEQEIITQYDVIMEGRDIGTIILPNADLKVFLTASNQVRAQRRYDELKELKLLEEGYSVETILEELNIRDYNDSHRKIAPLKKADDAIEIITDNLNIEQVVLKVISLFLEKIKGNGGLKLNL